MMKIKIKFQSMVDVITNSSTEVFVVADDLTVKHAKNLLCAILNISTGELNKRFKVYTQEEECYNDMDLYNVNLIIECKSDNDKDKEAMKLINKLLNSFSYEAAYIG